MTKSLRGYPCDEVPESIVSLNAVLEPLLRDDDTFRVSLDLMRTFRAVDYRSVTLGLIGEICGSSQLLENCVARSVTHPLGFDNFALFSTELYQLRLHVWWPGREPEHHEDIHDHRFDFVSFVLSGRMIVELYEIANSGQCKVLFIDHPQTAAASTYDLARVGDVRVRQVSTHELICGSAYITRFDSLHRIVPDRSEPLITLFLKKQVVRDDANVLVEPTAAKGNTNPPVRWFDAPTARATLVRVARHLMA